MNFNYIMKAVSGSLLLLAPCLSIDAAPLTPEQALQRVKTSAVGKQLPGKASLVLTHTESSKGEDVLFIFNRGDNGFIIASADDRMPAVLGYSDNGIFDLDSASPELKWWLEQYAEEAAYCFQNTTLQQSLAAPRAERAPIAEMLETRWDQNLPYNLDCPQDNGGRCVTGCVATAMAQVMKYHNYPVTGEGTHTYYWNGTTLGFDYGTANFDYDNMLPVYDGSADYVQQKAVAQLMYACGVSVNMNYTSDQSGASDLYVPYALKEFFNYDAGVRYLKREYYNTNDWEDIVYSELQAGRPVIYGGQAPEGGHEFVCDGYDSGYYHINWGWSGRGNGWFLLSALDPGIEGIGGFSGGYNSQQSLVCGIKPSVGNSEIWYPIYATGSLSVSEVYGNYGIALSILNGGIFNYSAETLDATFYVKAVDESGNEYLAEQGTELSFTGAANMSLSGYNGFSMYLPFNLTTGNYKVYVVFQTAEGAWQDLYVPLTMSAYLNMNVDAGGNLTFTQGTPEEHAEIRVTNFSAASTVVSGESTRFDVTLENIGEVEYAGPFYANVFTHGTNEQLTKYGINVSLAPGEIFEGYLNMTYNLPDGLYDLICYDMYDEQISDIFPLWIGVPSVIMPTEIVLSQNTASMEAESTLQLTATVLPEDSTDKTVIWSSSNPEIANVNQDGLVTAFSAGEVTITAKSQAVENVSANCVITVTPKVIEAQSVSLDITEATLTVGEILILTATVEPKDATDKTVTWTSSAPEVAAVENGVVTALSFGTAVITATTANGLKATCVIEVKKEPEIIYATSITIDQTSVEAEPGTVFTLIATVLPEDTTDKTVAWTSSDENIATVDDFGNVKILSFGYAVITASTTDGTDLKAECKVGMSGIESLIKDTDTADVYSINGCIVKRNADISFLTNLPKGTYLIRVNGKTHKVIK